MCDADQVSWADVDRPFDVWKLILVCMDGQSLRSYVDRKMYDPVHSLTKHAHLCTRVRAHASQVYVPLVDPRSIYGQ